MIKMMNILKEGGKLFYKLYGLNSDRITTTEMNIVFNEIQSKLSQYFDDMQLTKSLSSKQDHGDVDIICIPKEGNDIKSILSKLGNNNLKFHKNGNVYSILYQCNKISKDVHVDFIKTNTGNFISHKQYFSLNDFSGIVGIFSKRLNFKYGSEGFFKKYKDKKNNWHEIFITNNLMDGLKILGFNSNKFNNINTVDDIIEFMLSSPLVDVDDFKSNNMNQSDRKSEKRPIINTVITALRKSNKKRTIEDSDYFFKKLFPKYYDKVQEKIKKIDNYIIPKSKYSGEWLLKTFSIKQGKIIGNILKDLNSKFGQNLEKEKESIIIKYIKDKYKI